MKHIQIDPDGTEYHYENGKLVRVVMPKYTTPKRSDVLGNWVLEWNGVLGQWMWTRK